VQKISAPECTLDFRSPLEPQCKIFREDGACASRKSLETSLCSGHLRPPTQTPMNEQIPLERYQTGRPRRTGTLIDTKPQRAS
jgi:hypothetical protein